MKAQLLGLFLFFSFFSLPTHQILAQENAGPGSNFVIIYGSTSWNTSPTKIDTAFLVIRDKLSKKLLQVELEESAPDSAHFRGQFSFQLNERESVSPEVYIPPQSLRGQMDQFYQLIQTNKIARKPIIIKRTKNERIIDVFDTREQAQRAWEAFQQSQALIAQSRTPKTPVIQSQPDILADVQAMALKEEVRRKSERIRLEQIEKQKLQARLEEQKKLDTEAKRKRQEEARKLSEEGMVAYQAQDYAAAEQKFQKSAELDPENKDFYYRYGVSLYKNDKFNEALVAFEIAPAEPSSETEKNYYMGLAHYKLKENKPALERFGSVAQSEDPVLMPSALFYQGVLLFDTEKYEEAKVPFEKVLDVSQDPKLDERAEEYLEAIARAQTLAKMREKKWHLTGVAGLMYDSNVLLAPDLQTAQGSSQKEGDIRLLTIGDLTYKAFLSETSSLDLNANANLTNSSKNDLAVADPWLYSFNAPYSFQLGSPTKRITLSPGYESLFMAESGNSSKKNILNSYLARLGYMSVISQTWFSSYNLEYRMDDFSIASSVGDNDLDASRITLGTTQTFLIGARKKEALAGTFRLARNDAKGKNRLYNRYEVGLTYAKPVWKSSAWTSSLNYYYLDFPDATTSRKDNNFTLTSSLAKPIRDWFTWGVTGSYSNNDSTQPTAFAYSRYTLMTTATFNTAF